MKIIDEKGRLFGKINIIDFLLLSFLIYLIPALYFMPSLLFKKTPQKELMLDIEISCSVIKIKPGILKLIAVGDSEMDENKQKIGELTWIGKKQDWKYEFDIESESPFEYVDNRLSSLPIKLKIMAEIIKDKIYYNGQLVTSKTPFYFHTNKYTLECLPIIPKVVESVELEVRFASLPSEISTLINEGHLEKDKDGNVIAKLLKINNSSPSQFSIVNSVDNKFVFINDPYRKDIVATLEVICVEKNGVLYFKNYPIKIGAQISFVADLYIATGIITKIKKNSIENVE